MINFLINNEIDRKKWDDCIARSTLSLPYAFSWYLDIVCPEWGALIEDDYHAVMPLPIKKKWMITYIYKPYYAQQLGIIGPEPPGKRLILDFIRKIPEKFKYINTNLNETNLLDDHEGMKVNVNHLINTGFEYKEIYKNYSRNCRRNIKKATDKGLIINNITDIPGFVKFVYGNLEKQIAALDKQQCSMLEKIIEISMNRGMGQIYGVFLPENELCAAGFFIETRDRCVFSVCASNKKGKEADAMYLLVNSQIEKSAGIKKWFDFSGSNLEGVAYFNQSFGATSILYPTLHINRLPFFMRLIKP
jgi:lipid II:glycine glycyltransferase (peptidoglycan interpeptide bridge formation enzyme)